MRTAIAFILLASTASAADVGGFLSAPRTTGFFRTVSVSENSGPYTHVKGTDLMRLNADGTETLLIKGQDDDKRLIAVLDWCPSLDGKLVYYSHVRTFADRTGLWCDLFKLDLATSTVTQLTNSRDDASPPVGSGAWQKDLSVPPGNYPKRAYLNVWNTSPCDTPLGLVFTSNRNGIKSPGEFYDAMQLFLLRGGKHLEQIGSGLDLGGAAHPTLGPDGKIYFSTGQQQSRGGYGNRWAIWKMNPDGTEWEPVFSTVSTFLSPQHFQTVTTDGSIVLTKYYDTRVYGMLILLPKFSASPFGPRSPFGPALQNDNPPIATGVMKSDTRFHQANTNRYGFQPLGAFAPFPWAKEHDSETIDSDGEKLGMLAHPAGLPGNGLAMTWTGNQGDALMNLGIYKVADVSKTTTNSWGLKAIAHLPSGLTKIVDKPDRHEWMYRPLVPFKAIYGVDPPVATGSVAKELPAGSPFSVIGTSSLNWREITVQPDKRIAFPDTDIEYIRIIGFNPTTRYGSRTLARGPESGPTNDNPNSFKLIPKTYNQLNIDNAEGFFSQINERTGILADIPVKKWRKTDGSVFVGPDPGNGATAILDPSGKPDTSFRAIIPADVSWTFQLLNKYRQVILDTTAQTWHQVRPGEQRWNCNGCHAHHEPSPFTFEKSFAATAEYRAGRYTTLTLTEYFRDVKPIQDKYGLDWGLEPWKTFAKPYESAKITADLSTLTAEEKLTVYRWVDTGLMAAGEWAKTGTRIKPEDRVGPYVDNVPPTLAAKVFADRIVVGAFDWQSGVNKSTLSIKADVAVAGREPGVELADLFTHDSAEWTWTLSATVPAGTLTVSVRDNQVAKDSDGAVASELGNVATRTFALGGGAPSTDDEIVKLKAELAKVTAERDAYRAKVAAFEAWLKLAPQLTP